MPDSRIAFLFAISCKILAKRVAAVGLLALCLVAFTAHAGQAPPIDTDGDGIADSLDTDDDNDGMSDVCENTYGFDPLDPSDGGSTNTDGDGASNAHECKHGTDPTRKPGDRVMPDTDGDGMHDIWEANYQLDPDDASDAANDDDGDGYSNIEEFRAGTIPQWNQSHPDSVPESWRGFGGSYAVKVGAIDPADQLEDILVTNTSSGVLPAVSDFVLVQKANGGFEINDSSDYMIPAGLTDISSLATAVDLDVDGVKDMVLSGIDKYITGAHDLVVYGNSFVFDQYDIPKRHASLGPSTEKFFADVAAWIDDEDYFEDDVPVSGTLEVEPWEEQAPPIGDPNLPGDERPQIASLASVPDWHPLGFIDISDADDPFWGDHGCVGWSPAACIGIDTTGSLWGWSSFLYDYGGWPLQIDFESAGIGPIMISGGSEDAEFPDEANVYDVSGFDQDARLLVLQYFSPVRESGSWQPASESAQRISDMLEAVLGSAPMAGELSHVGKGVFSQVPDHESHEGLISDILQTMDYVRDRLSFPDARELDYSDSPSLDELGGSDQNCHYLKNKCTKESFTIEERTAIKEKIDELYEPLHNKVFSNAEEAAIAIHESELYRYADKKQLEVGVVIDDFIPQRTKLRRVETSYDTTYVEIYYGFHDPLVGITTTWHNHPSGRPIWQGDAYASAIANLQKICDGVTPLAMHLESD